MPARVSVAFSLVQDLLAAAGSQEGWQVFLTRLCDAVGGSGASLISHDLATPRGHVAVTARTPAEAVALYHATWSPFDPWVHSGIPFRSGSVVIGEQLIDRKAFERTAFCNEFARHYDIWQCLAGVVESSSDAMSAISINADRHRPFHEADAGLIRVLMPSLRRALQVHRRLAGAELMAANALDALDRLPHGVILLSPTGRVLSTNRAADRILRVDDGLSVERGELRGSTPHATAELRVAIKAALQARVSMSPATNRAVLALPRASGKRALSVVISPLPRREPVPGCESAGVILFVTDPESVATPDADAIRSIFRLTRSEAELVHCLAKGLTLNNAARSLGLGIETVRKRLKIVFEKTNTHRQSELVLLVSAVPWHRP